MFYRTIKFVLSVALQQFFATISRSGQACEQGPLVVVGNHQNFALDSLVISTGFKRSLWYLGKATLFNNPALAWLLRAVHVAPLYRKQDDPSLMSKNADTFDEVVQNLAKGRGVLLFPEGMSLGERALAPIKTGAARMALMAQSKGIPVKIQAAGLTFTDLKRFKSSVTLTFAEPFLVSDFVASGELDEKAAAKRITERIEAELKKVTVQIENREHEELIEKIAKLYRSHGSTLDDRARFAVIASNVEAIAPKMPEKRLAIERKLADYFELAALFGFDGDEEVSHNPLKIWSLPLFALVVLGVIFCFFPYRLVGIIAEKCSSHPVHIQSNKLFLGIFLFPLWFLFLALIVGFFTSQYLFGILAFLVLCLLATLTNRYLTRVRATILGGFWPGRRTPVSLLKAKRDSIVQELESLRVA